MFRPKKSIILGILFFMGLVLPLSACRGTAISAEPTLDIAAVHTQVAGTLAAEVPALPVAVTTTESPEASPTEEERLLLQEDFSDVMSGWEIRNESAAVTDYRDGAFVILVNKPDTSLWSKPHGIYQNVYIAVDALQTAGPNKNLFGIICRYQDRDNFYRFVIGADGYAGITKRSNGAVTVISDPLLTVSDAVNQGFAANHIEAICSGNRLTLFVNSQLVAEAIDDDFAIGEIGLIASSGPDAGVEVQFDNFVVSEP